MKGKLKAVRNKPARLLGGITGSPHTGAMVSSFITIRSKRQNFVPHVQLFAALDHPAICTVTSGNERRLTSRAAEKTQP